MTPYEPQNVFARILRGEIPAHKVYEDDHTFAFMDVMPRADGHVLVIPKNPSRTILDVAEDDLIATILSVQKVARAVKTATGADGITLQQFSESAGGQVVFHLHFHVIPRMEGVPLRPHTGEMARPEALSEAAERIRRALGA